MGQSKSCKPVLPAFEDQMEGIPRLEDQHGKQIYKRYWDEADWNEI